MDRRGWFKSVLGTLLGGWLVSKVETKPQVYEVMSSHEMIRFEDGSTIIKRELVKAFDEYQGGLRRWIMLEGRLSKPMGEGEVKCNDAKPNT